MSYISDAIKYMQDGRPFRTSDLSEGIKCNSQQASVVITQLLQNGRAEMSTPLPRNRHSLYAITPAGILALQSGEMRTRPRSTDPKPRIPPKPAPLDSMGIVAAAKFTQPTSVWALAEACV